MLECHICNKLQNSVNGLAKHIFFSHKNISRKEYYDRYIAKQSPLCICGKEKKFRDLDEGYRKYCSVQCRSNHSAPTSYWQGKKQPQSLIDRRRSTIFDRYGVSNGLLVNPSKAVKYKGFVTRSSYERNFIDFAELYGHQLSIPERIQFEFNQKKRFFYPDFYIENLDLIVEIKSCWTFNQQLELNIVKQVCTLEQGHNIMFIDEEDNIDNPELWNELNEYILLGCRP